MSEFDGIKRTRIQQQAIVNPNAARTQSFFDIAAEAQSMQTEFANEAKQEAADAGRLAGQNSVAINKDGSVTRTAIPDAGRYYTKEFMGAQRVAAKGALETNIRLQAQEFITENQNNPDAAAVFAETFGENYLKPLIESLAPDIRGQVQVMADGVFRGTLNTLTDIEMKRQHDESLKAYDNSRAANLKNMAEMYRNGQIEQADALKAKIFDNAGEAYPRLLTLDGINALNLDIQKAEVGGKLVLETESMSDIEARNRINDFKESSVDGLGPADLAEIADEAEIRVVRRAQMRNIKRQLEVEAATPQLHAVQIEINNRRLALRRDEALSISEIKQIYADAGIPNPDHYAYSEHYYSNLMTTKGNQDALVARKVNIEADQNAAGVEAGTRTVRDALNGPWAKQYSMENVAQIRLAHMKKVNADLKLFGKVWIDEAKKQIETGQWDDGTIDSLVKQGDVNTINNLASLRSAVDTYEKSDAYLYNQALPYISAGQQMPDHLKRAYEAESLKRKFGGKVDLSDESALANAAGEALLIGYIPPYTKKAISDNWRKLSMDQKTLKNLLVFRDELADRVRVKELPDEFNEAARRLEELVTLPEDKFADAMKTFFGQEKTDEVKLAALEARYGKTGSGMSDAVFNTFAEEVNTIIANSSDARNIGAAMIGGSTFMKRFFGADFANVQGSGITPDELKGMFNTDSPDYDPDIFQDLNDMAFAFAAANDPTPMVSALEAMSQKGLGVTRLSGNGGKAKIVRFSFEKDVENGGFGSAREFLQAHLKEGLEDFNTKAGIEPGLQSKASINDFGGDSYWTRLWDTSIGEDLSEQIEDNWWGLIHNDFDKAYDEGRIKLIPYDQNSKTWAVQITLGSKQPNGKPHVIELSRLLQVGAGGAEVIAKSRVKDELNSSEIMRGLADPSAVFNKINSTRFNKSDQSEIGARTQQFQQIIQNVVVEHGRSLDASD